MLKQVNFKKLLLKNFIINLQGKINKLGRKLIQRHRSFLKKNKNKAKKAKEEKEKANTKSKQAKK